MREKCTLMKTADIYILEKYRFVEYAKLFSLFAVASAYAVFVIFLGGEGEIFYFNLSVLSYRKLRTIYGLY